MCIYNKQASDIDLEKDRHLKVAYYRLRVTIVSVSSKTDRRLFKSNMVLFTDPVVVAVETLLS